MLSLFLLLAFWKGRAVAISYKMDRGFYPEISRKEIKLGALFRGLFFCCVFYLPVVYRIDLIIKGVEHA